VSIARREGLPLPVPVTLRFRDAPGSDEAPFQEQVVAHLGLPDWDRLEMTTELDSVGVAAQRVFARHGLVWPFNTHFHEPMLRRAAGASLLTGIGGDELLGAQRWYAAVAVLARRRPPARTLGRTVALALAPRRLRQARIARRREIRWPWLRPDVEDAANEVRARWHAQAPLAWDRGVRWWWRSRARAVLLASMHAVAEDCDVRLVHPFLEPAVLAAATRTYGWRGPEGRGQAMRTLFRDVLPDAVLTRRSKAFFDQAFFSEPSREFVRTWTGDGVDTELVDPDRLAATWRAERPDPRSFLVLQAAWLSSKNVGQSQEA
jgi:asparagine synthase (glutamine-hydrolysing)